VFLNPTTVVKVDSKLLMEDVSHVTLSALNVSQLLFAQLVPMDITSMVKIVSRLLANFKVSS
jgi:hypothetical protein